MVHPSRLRTPRITYVAETEHDAERLRGQLDAPVHVRPPRYTLTIDATTGGGIGLTASRAPQTPEVPGKPTNACHLVL